MLILPPFGFPVKESDHSRGTALTIRIMRCSFTFRTQAVFRHLVRGSSWEASSFCREFRGDWVMR